MSPRKSRQVAAPEEVHPAVRRARQVVGLYGDPDVTWSILLELELATGLDRSALADRLGQVVREHPHLGRPPDVEEVATSGRSAAPADRERFANRPYGDVDPLIRVGLTSDGRVLLLAAHHGVIDGLGLVGLAGLLLATPLGTNARGVARSGAEPGFLRGAVRRLSEVVFRPPERYAARVRDRGVAADVLAHADLPSARRGTAALAWAALVALRRWNGPLHRFRQPVIALGISRRPGTAPIAPDRDTAYSRVVAMDLHTSAELAARVAATDPEPDFPVSDAGGFGPLLVRLLASRLGATVLVSNLGLLEGRSVEALRFWPAASGPAGVAFGLASTRRTTTLTARARGGWFSRQDAEELLGLAQSALLATQ